MEKNKEALKDSRKYWSDPVERLRLANKHIYLGCVWKTTAEILYISRSYLC